MLTGYIIYVILLGDILTSSVATEPNMGLIFVGNIFGAGLLAYIYNRWASISTFNTGAMAGLVIGLLMGLYFDIMMLSTTSMLTTNGAILDVIGTGVMFSITGGVVGLVLGKLAS